jgi:hypothetical protein
MGGQHPCGGRADPGAAAGDQRMASISPAYDIFYYFISGLSIHGDQFINNPEIHNPALLQNEFEFERKNAEDGFENQKLFRIRYNRNYEIVSEN